ncbi:flippase [Methanosarcina acetivorans]|uniref:Polysaccharide biosynthesis protein n=1 Tax=Methanosarcina acetivorans (strain ATCC 35395 / DSM 2834 / JCM 12185 / C2A) TaxID=188937 RepID=Q8TRW4_METAC|nr:MULTISPECIES: flippase [Bacteria]AAM04479.1 polysaccharide biosynthesis protein [Methanosarcina acetivorans C2A]HBW59768.1 flippase [Thermoanaerobacter sp.]
MSHITHKSLKRVAQSATIIFIGTIINLFLGFLGRILLIRFTTQNEYGLYSMAFTLMSVLITISTLGLYDGTTRYIAKFRAENKSDNIQDTVLSSMLIALISSVLITILAYTASGYIAINIYDLPELSPVFNILLIAIPLSVLSNIFISIFRGFGESKIKVFLNEILRPVTYLLFLIPAVFLQFSFHTMVYVYVISILITFLAFLFYFIRKPPLKLNWNRVRINHITKELLVYSLPLLAVNILLTVMSWTDTLMLGYFRTPEVVGMYNAAYTIANLLSVFINSVGYLYVPIISQLYSKNQIEELGVVNATSTKWAFMFTFPMFALFFLYPDFILTFFYDSRYVASSTVFQILVLGFITNAYFGLNYHTLMSAGKSYFLMNCSLISSVLNIILNLILIPPFGMVGAAIASALSFASIEVYMTVKLYKFLKIHPFTNVYLRFTFVAISIVCFFYFVTHLILTTFWTLVILYSLFLLIYAISVLYTKSLDKDDLKLMAEIWETSGIRFSFHKFLKLWGDKGVN